MVLCVPIDRRVEVCAHIWLAIRMTRAYSGCLEAEDAEERMLTLFMLLSWDHYSRGLEIRDLTVH